MAAHDIYATLAQLKKLNGGDALFRPSSIDRVIKCPGSVPLSARSPKVRRTSRYAEEGSAAHVVSEQALKGIRQPDEWTDRMVQLDGGGMQGWFVDAEMVEATGAYIDIVRSAAGEPGVELLVEHRMSLSALDPNDPMMAENRGTGDAVLLNRPRRRLGIKDLKYGKGVMVAGDSPQLKNYAILALLGFPDVAWEVIELEVIQPRAVDERQRQKTFEFDPADLMMDFLGQLLQAMHEALGSDPPLKTGSHCRWCPAKDAGTCPAIQAEATLIGRDSFTDLPAFTAASSMGPIPGVHVITIEDKTRNIAIPPGAAVLPSIGSMDASDIATVLDRRHLYDTWIEAVEQRACSLIEAGVNVPGWMMSARSGNRRWKGEEAEIADALRALGVKTSEMYSNPELLSPAKVEKTIKKNGKALIEPLVERPMGKPTLMRATDERESIAVPTMGAIT